MPTLILSHCDSNTEMQFSIKGVQKCCMFAFAFFNFNFGLIEEVVHFEQFSV